MNYYKDQRSNIFTIDDNEGAQLCVKTTLQRLLLRNMITARHFFVV